ncbi:MAG: helix-turn-helix domain-containing protein [Chloroflexaceae bacterium]|nr:helix-turn-helix domain-containing protein [Chloroflexaceae bacterium]
MSLGQKIGRLRQERGLTLQEVSAGSGLTPSFLSRLERDKVNISVANLRKLALFFNVQMTYFFEGEENQQAGQLVRSYERVKLSLEDAPVQVFSLLPANGDIEARLIEAKPGSGQQGFSGKGNQMVYLLDGTLRYQLGEEEYVLEAGDTLFYNDDLAHTWTNTGENLAVILTINAANGNIDR